MSPDPQQPDDRELDAFLEGRDPVSRAWRQRPDASTEPPAALDTAVLDFARRSQQPKVARWRRLQRPLALAAVLVLSLSVLMRMPVDVSIPPAPSKAKREVAEVAKVEEPAVTADIADADTPPPPAKSAAIRERPAKPDLPPPPEPVFAPPGVRQKLAAAIAARPDLINQITVDDLATFPDSKTNEALQRVPGVAMPPAPAADVAALPAESQPVRIAGAPAPAASPALIAPSSAAQPEAALVIGSRSALDRRKTAAPPAAVPLSPSPQFAAALAAAAPPSDSVTAAVEATVTAEAQSQARQRTEALFTAAQAQRSKRQAAADLVARMRATQAAWVAPEFQGLKLGVATRDQVRERFGAPESRAVTEPWPDADAGSNRQIDVYPRIPGVDGQVEFHYEPVSARLMSVRQQLATPRISSELLRELKWPPASLLIHSGIGDPCAASGLTGEGPPYWWLYPAQGAYLALPVAGRVEQIVYEAVCQE